MRFVAELALMIPSLKKATSSQEYQTFIHANPQIDVPLEYLEKSDVYLLCNGGEVIGGFVYGSGPEYRYIERMEDPECRERYGRIFSEHKVAELTILWLKRRYRKSVYSTALWCYVALRSFLGPADYIVFGTSVPILVKALDYPRSTVRILTFHLKREYRDRYKLGALSLFVVERSRTLQSMLQGIYFLVFRPVRRLRKDGALKSFVHDE